MFSAKSHGSFKNTESMIKNVQSGSYLDRLDSFGQRGVQALRSATPVDGGETANSWSYKITRKGKNFSIAFLNSEMAGTAPLAILLQYGHGTKNGGYVQGRDYINPAIQPVFDEIANAAWEEILKT